LACLKHMPAYAAAVFACWLLVQHLNMRPAHCLTQLHIYARSCTNMDTGC
jgi:hypothetical protein